MPQGKGTYGSQVGRPPKKQKKYKAGGKVGMNADPFSTKNPEGLPHQQMIQAIEKEDARAGIEEDIPTTDAMERSEVSPDTTEYKEGGKVDITDVVKETEKSSKSFDPSSDESFTGYITLGDPKKWGDISQKALIRRNEQVQRKQKSVKKLAKKALEGKKK